MLEIATKANGEMFAADEAATVKSIAHDMNMVEFMVFCDENPLPILCECGCGEVADHNALVHAKHGNAPFLR